MSTASRVWTYADLEQMPESQDGTRYEIIDGELIVTPSPIPLHEELTMEVIHQVDPVIRSRRLGRLYGARVDVKLAGDDTVTVVPDLFFIARDRLHIVGPKAIIGAPDLVVEILSPSTRDYDLGPKKALYARYGVQEYWIIDPAARSLAVLVLRGDRYEELPHDGSIAHSLVLPDLTIDLAALFSVIEA
jgi:Uma2 family endonuclease